MAEFYNQRFDEGPSQDEIIQYPFLDQSIILFDRFSDLRRRYSKLGYAKLLSNFTEREQYELDCYRAFNLLRRSASFTPNLFYGSVNFDALYDETIKFILKVDDPQYNFRSPVYLLLVHIFLSRYPDRAVPFYSRDIKKSDLWQHQATILSNIQIKLNSATLISYGMYVNQRAAVAASFN